MSAASPEPADVATLSYEEARAELVETVRRLEAGSAPLEESLALWERGEALADRCEEILDGARARLDARGDTRNINDTGLDSQEEDTADDSEDDRF